MGKEEVDVSQIYLKRVVIESADAATTLYMFKPRLPDSLEEEKEGK